jgi:3'-phosphoadenosine 5'-phosphosulfate sulfotransferase (PAPS reductase)/FAD synthetase
MAGAFAEPAHRDGAQLWLNPILDWTEKDKNRYMEEWELPRNEVVDVLHRSGECLCGAFTAKGEFRMIELFYPEAAKTIRTLEAEVVDRVARGDRAEHSMWGRRDERENPDQLDFLPMCVGCMQEEPA